MTDATDPQMLLRWMRARDGDIPARAISDAGPRAFRRRPAADAALAALIRAGAIIEVSPRPRTFRVEPTRLPSSDEIRARLDAELESRRHLPDEAAAFIAAVDLRLGLMRELGCTCRECERVGELVDDAVMSMLGCGP